MSDTYAELRAAANDDGREPEREPKHPLPCPRCGRRPEAHESYRYSVSCDNCYDGAIDAGPQLIGTGRTADAAVNDWDERVIDEEVSQ